MGALAYLRMEDVTLSERKGTLIVRCDRAKEGKQRQVPEPREERRHSVAYPEEHPPRTAILFLGQLGALCEDAIGRVVGKYAIRAKVERVTPHVRRHSFAYNYLYKLGMI